VPTPILPAGPIELRVGHVVNPRFPRFTERQIALMLAETARVARAHFGIELVFAPVETVDIAILFARFDPQLSQYLDGMFYDVRSGAGDRQRVHKAMLRAVNDELKRVAFDDLYGFAAPYLAAQPASRDPRGLADAVADTLLAGLTALRDAPAPDGGPMIDASRYNEFVYWDSIGYAALPWDVIITNQPLASAEYYALAIHVAVRGGIGPGLTDYSRDGRYGAISTASTFPFTSAIPEIVRLRGGESYDSETAARLAGAYHAHEIGHQLFRFGHPFGNPHCVMTPVELLKFREWHDALEPARCTIGSSKAMAVGAIVLRRDPRREPGAAK